MSDKREQLSKKDRRLESKKRKVAAFLKLVDEENRDIKKPMKTSKDCRPCTVPIKKAKHETLGNPDEPKSSTGGKQETEDERKRIRKILEEKRKEVMARPKIFLCLDELRGEGGLPPLFILDVQHLILFALEGNITNFKPRWCKLLRCTKVTSVVIVVLDGVGETDYHKYRKCFTHTDAMFDMSIPLVSPSQYGKTVDQELFSVPTSVTQLKKDDVPTPLAHAIAASSDPKFRLGLAQRAVQLKELPPGDAFPRTHLLLSNYQMSRDHYPLPLVSTSEEYKGFVFTSDVYTEVTDQSPMFCIDCEMCITYKDGEKRSELTWVAIVNEDLEVIYETLVKPERKIQNYLTRYSGVTKEMLKTVTTRLEEVQHHLRSILPPNAILCGQSLNADLRALKMFHPYVIDTSVIYSLSGFGKVKPSLRNLASLFLGKLIQDEKSGHNPGEDAISTMELVQLKLKKDITFGDLRFGGVIYPNQANNMVTTGEQQNTAPPTTEHSQSDSTKQTEAVISNLTDDDINESCSEKSDIKSSNQCQTDFDTSQADLSNRIHCANEKPESDRTWSKCDTKVKLSPSELLSNEMVDIKEGSPDSSGNNNTKLLNEKNGKLCNLKDIQQQMERRKHFFTAQGYFTEESFFARLKRQKKSATLVDSSEVNERYRSTQDESVQLSDTFSDKASKTLTKMAAENRDFVWTQLHNYHKLLQNEEDCSADKKMRCLQKMDRRVSRMFRPAPQSSVCVVILTGRTDDANTTNNAMSFVRIKV